MKSIHYGFMYRFGVFPSTRWTVSAVLVALLCGAGCGDDETSGSGSPTDIVYDLVGFDAVIVPDTGGFVGGGDTTGGTKDSGGGADSADGTSADSQFEVVEDIIVVEPGDPGYPCDENSECNSGFCVEGPTGKECAQLCVDECKNGWSCENVLGVGGDVIYLCVWPFGNLCKPCSTEADCNIGLVAAKNACIDFGGNGWFCGVSCSSQEECPEAYTCKNVTLESGLKVGQCVPDANDCVCSDASIAVGAKTACYQKNQYGTCNGQRICTEDGITDCSAQVPGEEICNGIDDNCDGITDPPATADCTNYFIDTDGDGFGVGIIPECACKPPTAKHVTLGGDCNDLNPDVKPGVAEMCDNIDNDCDGSIDEPGSGGCTDFYADSDGDEFGDPNNVACLCKIQGGYVTGKTDCNDSDATINPTGFEVCDGKDNDCDGTVDEENSDGCIPYFLDQDADGFGVDDKFQCLCAASPPYSALVAGDCNDNVASIAPFKPELCDNIDNDCDGETDEGSAEELCGVTKNGVTACVGGQCVVGDCTPGFYDIDFDPSNGCECKAPTIEVSGPVCQKANDLGVLPDNSATITVQGNAVYADESDWYTFKGVDGPDSGNCDSYHVRIRFLWNPGNAYVFDVHRGSCAAGDQQCAQGADYVWRTDFFEGGKGECPCLPGVTKDFHNKCSDNTAQYYVRVFRKPDVDPSCDGYNLEITNGVY